MPRPPTKSPQTRNPQTKKPRTESARSEPTRTCVGCRRPTGRSFLVRLVAADGRLAVGTDRPGRGAWLCAESVIDCFEEATKSRAWSRSFRRKIDADSTADVRNELLAIQQSINGD